MNLEFKVYKLEFKTKFGKAIGKQGMKEFIIVGVSKIDDIDCYKAHDIKDGSLLIPGVTIQNTALDIPKEDLKLKGDEVSQETCEMNIPKEFLTMDIVEEIQRLNGEG